MAETAAHLVDHVFPPLPLRQWVLAVPKRLRWYLEREPRALSAVLPIFLRVIERHLRQTSPGAAPDARYGAVRVVHRFGASLNRHVHFHCCVLDGVFAGGPDGQVQFRPAQPLTAEVLAAIATQVRRRVLRWFARSGLLEAADAQDMLTWEHAGFSLDAAVRMAGDERAGLERLLRYCARPAFALERLIQVNAERVVYRLPKPQPDGRTALSLTPLELLDRLVARLVNRLAAAAPASPPLPRGAGAPCAAARRGHRLRARRECEPRASARDHPSRVRTGRAHRPLPLGDPACTAVRDLPAGLPTAPRCA